MSYLFVAIGASLGGVCRFWISQQISWENFPWGTLLVNVLGSFLLGILFVVITEQSQLSENFRLFGMVGFLGAFTTFSTFSLESWQLFQQQEFLKMSINIVANVFLGLIMLWVGILLARYFMNLN